ncbi:hypothetical protein AAVH_43539, partial [Aphelenchoides avenae]
MRRYHHDDVADHHSVNNNEADNHDDSVYFNVDKHPNYHLDAIDNQHDYHCTEAINYYNYGYYYADVHHNDDRKGDHYYLDVDDYTDEYRHYDGIIHAELNDNDCGADDVVHKVNLSL